MLTMHLYNKTAYVAMILIFLQANPMRYMYGLRYALKP